MSFEKKKIQLETLSEYLTEIRKQLDLSQEQVAAKTGIKLKYLQYLEQGDLGNMPPDVYAFGFLRQLAGLYFSESEPLIAQYKKEKNIQQLMRKPSSPAWRNRLVSKLIITPKIIAIGVGMMFVLLTLGYVIWQVSSINKTPPLQIVTPQDRQIIKGSAVTISGKSVPGANVTINNQNVFVDNKGNFKTQIGITAGNNSLRIISSNKFGKATSQDLTVVGQAPFITQDKQVNLELAFTGEVMLDVAIDNTPSQNVNFHAGDNKTFIAKNKIVISTSNAGLTKALLNKQNLGVLGRLGEKLSDVQFLAESAGVNSGSP